MPSLTSIADNRSSGRSNPRQRTTIVIPAYNEADQIQGLITTLRQMSEPVREILVVNDGSSDGSVSNLTNSVNVRHHPYNIGSGAAIKTGIRTAKGDILIFMDGDGQHDPADIPRLLEHIDRYDMVVGARKQVHHTPWGRNVMNRIYNWLASYVTGFKVDDLTSGFRAIRADRARELLPLLPNRYSWPTTMTLMMLRSGMSVRYVPIHAKPRLQGRSHIRPLRDGIRFFLIIMKICTLYSPFRIFLPVAGSLFGLGLINYAHTFFSTGRFTNMSAVLFTSAVIVFMMGLVSEQISQISLLRQQVRSSDKGQPDGNTDSGQDGDA